MSDESRPMPWRVRTDRAAASASIDDAAGYLIAGNLGVAVAEFIVRVVNDRDRLTELLRTAREAETDGI